MSNPVKSITITKTVRFNDNATDETVRSYLNAVDENLVISFIDGMAASRNEPMTAWRDKWFGFKKSAGKGVS